MDPAHLFAIVGFLLGYFTSAFIMIEVMKAPLWKMAIVIFASGGVCGSVGYAVAKILF